MGEVVKKTTTTVGVGLSNDGDGDGDEFISSLSLSRLLEYPDWKLELQARVSANTEYSVGACIEKSSPTVRLYVHSSNEGLNATVRMPL